MKTWAQWRQVSLQVKLLDLKRPCLDQIGASDDIPLAPIRLMMDDVTITPSGESTLNIPIADIPTRAQVPGSSSPGAAPLDDPAQDIPCISSNPVNGDPCDEQVQNVLRTSSTSDNGAGRAFSYTGEEAELMGTILPFPFNC